jgi:hypothetical protein
MNNYHIIANTQEDKYSIMHVIRTAGAEITGVSGYGSGYYIQFDATPDQADYINRHIYTSEIHNLDAAGILAAWYNQEVTMHQVLTWQQRHGVTLEVTE